MPCTNNSLLTYLCLSVAVVSLALAQHHEPIQWGGMEDLSPFPTVSNTSSAQRAGDGGGGLVALDMPPGLRVLYDVFLNMSSPWADLQVFKISVQNDGPGDVTQLAVKIDYWNSSKSWWGIDTLDQNDTYQYLPKYRSPLRTGDSWTFGMIQETNRWTWPTITPAYGQTGDGRFFNQTSIIPSPPNPDGTNATLVKDHEKESFYKDQRWVVWSGHVQNTGNYPLTAVGLTIQDLTAASATWHLVFDPATNTSYLPLRSGPLHPKESQSFGFIMPLASGYPNVSLHHVTTPNALYNLTAPNVFDVEKPREAVFLGNGTTLEQNQGGLQVPFPPTHIRPRGQSQEEQQQGGEQGQPQQGGEQGQQQPAGEGQNMTTTVGGNETDTASNKGFHKAFLKKKKHGYRLLRDATNDEPEQH